VFEIRVICADPDTPSVFRALAEALNVTEVRRARTFDGTRTRLYITADQRTPHDECTLCGGEGTNLWFTPEGTEESRPCTGMDYDDMFTAGLIRRGTRTPQ